VAQGLEAETRRSSWACSELPPTIIATSFGLITLDIHRSCQIAAWTNAMALSLEETDQMRQKMAVQKHICSLRVRCAKLGIVAMTNYMIDVGRNDVAEALTPECGHNCARFGEFVVIDHQNVGHIIFTAYAVPSFVLDGRSRAPRLNSPVSARWLINRTASINRVIGRTIG